MNVMLALIAKVTTPHELHAAPKAKSASVNIAPPWTTPSAFK